MAIKDITMQNMLAALVHYIYRNTVIEDYHSDGAVMDGELYETIYKIVRRNLNRAKKFYPLLSEIGGVEHAEDVVELIRSSFSYPLAKEFAVFAFEVSIAEFTNYEWDEAKSPELKKLKNPVAFVLGGVFKEYCDNRVVLGDKAMCAINKDINNRIYTLLCKGYFKRNLIYLKAKQHVKTYCFAFIT